MSALSNHLIPSTSIISTDSILYRGISRLYPGYEIRVESTSTSTISGGSMSTPYIRDLKTKIADFLRSSGVPVLSVEILSSEGTGQYILITLECDAREALEYWLEVAGDILSEYGMPIFVKWTGEINISPEEMGMYIGRVLARMGVFLATERPLNLLKTFEEEWRS